MPSTLEQLTSNRVKLTVEIPFDELKPSLDKAYKDIAAQVNVPGFRKGKVPAPVIDQRFGRGAVLQEAINDALPSAYSSAVNANEIVPLGQPEIEVTKLEDNHKDVLVEFTAEVDVRPDFELPDLAAIEAEVPVIGVPDEDVDERIETLRQRFATNTEVDRPAQDGDVVVIDLEGSRDGEPLEDATAQAITYKLGSGGMLKGLDEAVTGLSAGDSKTFSSELLGGAHAGETADIKVTVTKVSEQELPEVDDEFAQLVSEFDTVDEMRADIRKALESMARLDQAADARDKVLEAVIGKIDIELPQALVDSELEARRNQVSSQLAQAGLTVEQYLKESEEEAEDEDAFWTEIEKRSLDALKAQVVLDKMADEEKIGVEQSDLSELIVRKAQQDGTTPEQEAQHMMEHNHLAEWMEEIRRGKALAQMVAKATVKDAAGEVLQLDRIQPDGSITDAPAADEQAEAVEADASTDDVVEAPETVEAPAAVEEEAPAEESAEKKPAARKPAAKKAATKKPAAKKATTKKPAAKKPVADK
ncbi:trigger factor [Acidipropionibacterium thoenii]|uniref:trigger factor n=1 Tax=Acidipropionibacterium thoenii TaxID=1751 RepID=UPI00040F181B|nr:trigger factor [Acidipropionibacterium thoenii]